MGTAKSQTPMELIKKLVNESRPEGGSIFLDDFCRQLPNASRMECVSALKNNKDILFIVGRKGHESRAFFGRMKDDYRQAPSFKSPAASGPLRNYTPRRRITPQSVVVASEGSEIKLDANMFRLRAVVQGQEVFIPIDELELVPTT